MSKHTKTSYRPRPREGAGMTQITTQNPAGLPILHNANRLAGFVQTCCGRRWRIAPEAYKSLALFSQNRPLADASSVYPPVWCLLVGGKSKRTARVQDGPNGSALGVGGS